MTETEGKLKAVRIRTDLFGETGLLMHNIRLANPDDPFAKAISRISGKRKKTEEDRREMAKIEFLGSLYTYAPASVDGSDTDTPEYNDETRRVVMPQTNVKRAFKEAAKATRQGRTIDRALNFADPAIGERGLEFQFADSDLPPLKLWELGKKYQDITMVTVSGRVPRCRPRFLPWALSAEWLVFPTLLDLDTFKDIVEMCGLIEGLGDNRVNGAGRFKTKVTVLG